MNKALVFPNSRPHQYLPLTGEPKFKADIHLSLSQPDNTVHLSDLGYSAKDVAACESTFAYCTAFRVLSDEGVRVMKETCQKIYSNRNSSTGTGANRLGSYARGAGYRSTFIRDFCDSPELAEHISRISRVSLVRHSVPAVACGINYAPDDITKAVDTWHVDSVSFDMVMMLSDPSLIKGGEFQIFKGTKEQGQALLGINGEEGKDAKLPSERIETLAFPAAGYGFLQQGNMIFHRACRLLEKADRITMVPSFEVMPATAKDATNSVNMSSWEDPGIVPELARHELRRASARLQELLCDVRLSDDAASLVTRIDTALASLIEFKKNLDNKK
jgi:hypothetical protein